MARDYAASAPGVYIEEIPAVGPIQGAGTSTAAFVGAVAKADAPTAPTQVTNWTQYRDVFGEYAADKMMPYAVRGFFDNGGTRAYIVTEPNLDAALTALTRFDVNLLVAPDVKTRDAQLKILTHCRLQKDRFAICNLPNDVPLEDVEAQAGPLREPTGRGYGAIYYPWIQVGAPVGVTPPAGGATIDVPPVGHLAGIYARSDAQRGVHKAPANEVIQGALGVTALLNDAEHGVLNKANVNALRVFPNSPPMVWGARSLTHPENTAYRYVNVERLLIYIERSLQTGLRWAVFEPNDFTLWKKLERTVTEFLTRVWRSGALFGRAAEQAFFIKVDEEVNTAGTRALGQVIVEVGVAPVRPAEFIIIRLALREGGADDQG